MKVAQVSPGQVKVNTMMLGGDFGRRFAPDFAIDATLLGKLGRKAEAPSSPPYSLGNTEKTPNRK